MLHQMLRVHAHESSCLPESTGLFQLQYQPPFFNAFSPCSLLCALCYALSVLCPQPFFLLCAHSSLRDVSTVVGSASWVVAVHGIGAVARALLLWGEMLPPFSASSVC